MTYDYDASNPEFADIMPFAEKDLPVSSTAVRVLEELRRLNGLRKDAGETSPIMPDEPEWKERKQAFRERKDGEIVPVTSALVVRFNAPWRANSDSLSCALHIDDVSGEKGTYVDHRDRDGDAYIQDPANKFKRWTLYDLAFRLGIKPPRMHYSKQADSAPKKVAHTMAEYAEQRGIPLDYLTRVVGAREVEYLDPKAKEKRLAIAFKTPNAKYRYRFLGDSGGRYSKFAHDPGHGICLYGFYRAIKIAQKHGFTSLGIVNGESATWAGQYYQCPVFTISGEGEQSTIHPRLIEEMRQGWKGDWIVFEDNDTRGQSAAFGRQQSMRRHGLENTKLGSFGNSFQGYDLGDMAYEYGDQTQARYLECAAAATNVPTPKLEDVGTIFSPFHLERQHLAMLMFNPKLISWLPAWFAPSVYSTKQHQILAEALLALHSKGRTIESKTLMQWIDEHQGRTLFGNENYIREWQMQGTDWDAFESHTAAIHDAYKKREIAALANTIQHAAQNPDMDSEAILGQVQSSLNRIHTIADEGDMQSLGQIADDMANKKPELAISYGKPSADKHMGGIGKGDYILVAGSAGTGKTAWVTDAILHAAFVNRDTHMFLYVSQEVPKSHIAARMAASMVASNIFRRDYEFLGQQAMIVYSALIKGHETDRQRESWLMATGLMPEAVPNIRVIFGQHTVSQIKARANRLYLQFGKPVIVVVDYVQYLGFEPNLRFSRNEHIEYNAQALKDLMKHDSVWAVIGLSEAATEVEKFQGAQAADLSQVPGSKEFAYLSTTTIMIHPDRKAEDVEDDGPPFKKRSKPKGPQQNRVDEDDWNDYHDGRTTSYDPNKPLEKRKMWIQIMKNRNGEKGTTFPMFYIPAANCWLSNREPEPINYQSPHVRTTYPVGY